MSGDVAQTMVFRNVPDTIIRKENVMIRNVLVFFLLMCCVQGASGCTDNADLWEDGEDGEDLLTEQSDGEDGITVPESASGLSFNVAPGYAEGFCSDWYDYFKLVSLAVENGIEKWESETGSEWDQATNQRIILPSSGFQGPEYYEIVVTVQALTGDSCTMGQLTLTSLTSSSATFHWTSSNNANKYVVYLGTKKYEVTPDASVKITGLDPDTEYSIGVSAVCGGEVSESVVKDFRTSPAVCKIIPRITGPTILKNSVPPVWNVEFVPDDLENYTIEYWVQRGNDTPFSWNSTSTVLTFSPGEPGQLLKMRVRVSAPGCISGEATYSCLNSYER